MRGEQTKQTLKLRLLALLLALILIWYSRNPAPRPVIRKIREAEPPDEKKRNVEPQTMPTTFPFAFRSTGEAAILLPASDGNKEDLDWPEFIDG